MPVESTSPDPVAGVLLAAGQSRRVGQLKQALDWSGRSILRHVAETLLAAGLRPVCVVLGYERVRLAGELAGLDVHIVENPAYESGMFSSVRCGLAALPADVTSCVLALVDQPRCVGAIAGTGVDDEMGPMLTCRCDHMFRRAWAVHSHHQGRAPVNAEFAQQIGPARIAIEDTGAGRAEA